MVSGLSCIARHESWPLAAPFTIARGSKSRADVVVVELIGENARGRGEAVPYPRFGDSVEGVLATLESLRPTVESGITRDRLAALLGPGAARNALDCALWDLEAKRAGRPVWSLAGLPRPKPLLTAYTISLARPGAMAEAARRANLYPLLKIKLGGASDAACARAVREAAPAARLIVDANEGWSLAQLEAMAPVLRDLGVELIEQPLPAGEDGPLADFASPVPLCADESCRGIDTLDAVVDRYDYVNVKLDKSGGLSGALDLVARARALGLGIMIGSMVSTSLGVAPATLLGSFADFVDLDGPLLLARDRPEGLRFDGAVMAPPAPDLWG